MQLLHIFLLGLSSQYVEGSIFSKFREMFGLTEKKHPDKKLDDRNRQKIVEKELPNTPRTVPLRTSDFVDVMENNLMYVDKTAAISEIINGPAVILITRPERWGKSLGLSMMENFLANNDSLRRKHTIDLYKNLEISKMETFCKLHRNKYPTVSISWKDVSGDTYSKARESVLAAITKAFKQHEYLLERGSLTPLQRADFLALRDGTTNHLMGSSLKELTRYLCNLTGQSVVLILDEYDKPYRTAYSNGFYDEMHNMMTGILSPALKDNDFLGKAIVAGISLTSQASCPGIENAKVYSVLNDNRYSKLFGFTDDEVKTLLNEAGLSSTEKTFKRWYDGYVFSGNINYNPFSTMKFISEGGKPGVYWPNTASEHLLEDLLNRTGKNVGAIFFHLFQGGRTEAMRIFDNLHYEDLKKEENVFFTLMVHSGYLNAVPSTEHDYIGEYFLRIPNFEVNITLHKIFNKVFGRGTRMSGVVEFGKHIRDGNVDGIEKFVGNCLVDSGSYYTFPKVLKTDEEGHSGKKEYAYHSYLLGLFTSQKCHYSLKQQWTGKGHFDLGLSPNTTVCPQCPGYVFKYKFNPDEGSIDVTAEEGLKQIKDRQYEIGLQWSSSQKLIEVGVAFCGKKVSMRYEELLRKKITN